MIGGVKKRQTPSTSDLRFLKGQLQAYLKADPTTPLGEEMRRLLLAVDCVLRNENALPAEWLRAEMDKFVEAARGGRITNGST